MNDSDIIDELGYIRWLLVQKGSKAAARDRLRALMKRIARRAVGDRA